MQVCKKVVLLFNDVNKTPSAIDDAIAGTVMLEHVLRVCEQDGGYDNVYL